MREKIKYIILIVLLNSGLSYADADNYSSNKIYSFTGRLLINTFPIILIIEENTQNEERIFLKNLKANDTFKFADIVVDIKGKFRPYKKKSYILSVDLIKKHGNNRKN